MPDHLPVNGVAVRAETYASDEYDRPAKRVQGVFRKRWIAALEYWQCWVDDEEVDPATVRQIEEASEDIKHVFGRCVDTDTKKVVPCPAGSAAKGGGADAHGPQLSGEEKAKIKGLFDPGEVKKGKAAALAAYGEQKWNALPQKARDAAVAAFSIGKKLLYIYDTPLRMGLNLAKTVARERGLSDEHVAKVARVVDFIDQKATLPFVSKIAYKPLLSLLTPALGPVAAYTPVAALAYVGYSTARNPLATIRAARKLIMNPKKLFGTAEAKGDNAAGVEALLKAYEEYGNSDWFDALLMSALDESGDNLAEAVKMATAAIEANPNPPEEDAE